MFQFRWRRASPAILIVSEDPSEPLFDSPFLSQPNLRLLLARPDGAGLDTARRERPQLIIEELAATGEAGLIFWRRLRREPATQAIPLIVIASSAMGERANTMQANHVLNKPLSRREFFDAVRRYVPLPSRRTERLGINLRFTYSIDGRVGQLFSRDLSTHGASLKSDRFPSLGSRMELRFRLPGCWDEICCRAIVRSISGDRRAEFFGFGIEFQEMADADMQRLEAFLDKSLPRARR